MRSKSTSSYLRREIVTSVIAMLLFTVLLGVLYPLAVTGVGQVLFPGAANGSQVRVNGRLVGSKLIGQQFSEVVIGKNGKPEEEAGELVTKPDPSYFQSRPSATEPAYNAAASTFSNLGPNDKITEEEDAARIEEYLALNKPYDPSLTVAKIPVDAVNTSASGLDPEISVANAEIQAHRVAAVRHLSLSKVLALVVKHTKSRELGVLGEPGVNVLELNLALDEATKGS
ncbi:MAG TPA: potassium-transporting ATPase subunit C [Solirubrobacteraceae bacterium]|jgi:K+-transporting ATPase ATPase C chain